MISKFENREGIQAVNDSRVIEALQGNYVQEGLEVTTDGMDMVLDVASGTVVQGNTEHGVGDTTVTIPDNNETEPRKDVVYVDDTQSVQVATGAAASPNPALTDVESVFHTAEPSPPSLVNQDSVVILAEVWVEDGATEIISDHLQDRRLFLGLETGGSSGSISNVHTEYSNGLENEEIYRYKVDAGETFEVTSLRLAEKGGGQENTDFSIDIVDTSDGSIMASVNLNESKSINASGTEGEDVIFNITNDTGGTVTASFSIEGGT